MIIIVEGPKRSGKTTFCNMLKEFVKCPVIYVNERLPLTFDYTDKKVSMFRVNLFNDGYGI